MVNCLRDQYILNICTFPERASPVSYSPIKPYLHYTHTHTHTHKHTPTHTTHTHTPTHTHTHPSTNHSQRSSQAHQGHHGTWVYPRHSLHVRDTHFETSTR